MATHEEAELREAARLAGEAAREIGIAGMQRPAAIAA
jgi:hypothetical protein